MDDIRELAELLVNVVNEESNNYDAVEIVENILRATFPIDEK